MAASLQWVQIHILASQVSWLLLLKSFEEINGLFTCHSIREYLASVGEDKKYAVTAQNKTVTVSSISGEQMKSTETKSTDLGLFSCTHCGYVTRFETDLNAHRMIHYL